MSTPTVESIVRCDPEVLGGMPRLCGHPRPNQEPVDYLAAGDSLERFLDHFPSVTREQAVAALEIGVDLLVSRAHLLDESLPRPLGLALIGHDVSTVQQESWTSLSNGALLRKAATRFDVLMTADQNIEFQQNLATLPLAVVVLIADSNRLESLKPLVPDVLELLKTLSPKTLVRVGGL